jgi:hypothetical protein
LEGNPNTLTDPSPEFTVLPWWQDVQFWVSPCWPSGGPDELPNTTPAVKSEAVQMRCTNLMVMGKAGEN